MQLLCTTVMKVTFISGKSVVVLPFQPCIKLWS